MTLRESTTCLEDASYPLSAEELIEHVGDVELELPNGREDLATVIRRCGADSFSSETDAREAIYGALSEKAIGRPGYSDRDPTILGIEGTDQVSF
jgi:hypothetical protein